MINAENTTLPYSEEAELLQQPGSSIETSKAETKEIYHPDDTTENQGRPKEKVPEAPLLKGQALTERIAAAAKLDLLAYEIERKAIATESKVRGAVIDSLVKTIRKKASLENGIQFEDSASWDAPVELDALLQEIHQIIKRFIVCDPETAVSASLWIVFTWIIDQVDVAPLAVITAPEKGCGKSQLLNIMAKMVYRPLAASSISPAALYRVIEAHQPTLMIDETDTFMKENEDLRGIINSGHTRDSAYVIRTVGDEHTPTRFSTWGAKALSGIGKLPDTIMDRAIILRMRKRLPHESVERIRYAEPDLFNEINAKIQRCISDYGTQIAIQRPELPESLSDRAQDNWEPLLAIADVAGGDWPILSRKAAIKGASSSDPTSLGNQLVSDIYEVFESKSLIKISTADLIKELCEDEERPWATYNRGKPVTPHQIGKRLSEYGICSKTIRVGTETKKGFEASQFQDVFDRYVTNTDHVPDESVTRSQPATGGGLHVTSSVADFGNPKHNVTLNLNKHLDCDGVTDPWDQ